jgi:hypothetical protein
MESILMTNVSTLVFNILIYSIVLHILYMKSNAKALSKNFNATDLELFCQNRFYGPLVVAFNLNKPPFYLMSFSM